MSYISNECGHFINDKDKDREYKAIIEHLEELEKEKKKINIMKFVINKGTPYKFIKKYPNYEQLSEIIYNDDIMDINNQKLDGNLSFLWIFESLKKNMNGFSYKKSWDDNQIFLENVFKILDLFYDYPHILKNYFFKNNFVKHIGYSIPTYDSLRIIAKAVKDKVVLEIGSGTGTYAAILRMMGLNIRVTDNYSMYPLLDRRVKSWITIEKLYSLEAVTKYRDSQVLMSVWPPMDCMAEEALKEFKGDTFIYIGDKHFEFTGNYGLIEELFKKWKPVIMVKLLHFEDTEDYLIIYQRNN